MQRNLSTEKNKIIKFFDLTHSPNSELINRHFITKEKRQYYKIQILLFNPLVLFRELNRLEIY